MNIDRTIFKYPIDSRKCNDILSQFILDRIIDKAAAIACKDSLSDFFKLPLEHKFLNDDETLLGFYIWELKHEQGGTKN